MTCRNTLLALSATFVANLLALPALAQELSSEQREVWEFILNCNEQFASGNEAGILDCFHEDFSGWRYGDTVPRNKHTIAEFLPTDLEAKTIAHDLRPISIRVFGNFAVAHYFLDEATRTADGGVARQRMIWTDVLLKEGGRWRWVADHGGAIE